MLAVATAVCTRLILLLMLMRLMVDGHQGHSGRRQGWPLSVQAKRGVVSSFPLVGFSSKIELPNSSFSHVLLYGDVGLCSGLQETSFPIARR